MGLVGVIKISGSCSCHPRKGGGVEKKDQSALRVLLGPTEVQSRLENGSVEGIVPRRQTNLRAVQKCF